MQYRAQAQREKLAAVLAQTRIQDVAGNVEDQLFTPSQEVYVNKFKSYYKHWYIYVDHNIQKQQRTTASRSTTSPNCMRLSALSLMGLGSYRTVNSMTIIDSNVHSHKLNTYLTTYTDVHVSTLCDHTVNIPLLFSQHSYNMTTKKKISTSNRALLTLGPGSWLSNSPNI